MLHKYTVAYLGVPSVFAIEVRSISPLSVWQTQPGLPFGGEHLVCPCILCSNKRNVTKQQLNLEDITENSHTHAHSVAWPRPDYTCTDMSLEVEEEAVPEELEEQCVECHHALGSVERLVNPILGTNHAAIEEKVGNSIA